MTKQKSYRASVLLLIVISTLVRGFLAANLELGNDEVYYRLYALYPDWSHFDHPLMIGVVMQVFSLNMLLQSELFLRMSSVVFGAINIWMMYRIGCQIKNERTGFIAAGLYVGSIYATVISGIFILPDTPQSLFWLLSIYIMLYILPKGPQYPRATMYMLGLGLTLGLGILSKYTTIFLWLGVLLYVALYRKKWLKSKGFYLSLLVSLCCTLPIIYWNFQNDFISFTFHSGRVEMAGYGFNFNTLTQEILGEIFYNNPVNFILIVLSTYFVVENKLLIKRSIEAILVLSSLPLIASFILFSMFRETLPHWSAPAYTSLLIIVAAWLDQIKRKKLARNLVIASISLTGIILLVGYLQISFGLFKLGSEQVDIRELNRSDPTIDMFGYKDAGAGFAKLVDEDIKSGKMPEGSVLFGDNWFPLANYDYYAAYPIGMSAMGISDLAHLHKYAWINNKLGGFTYGMSGYYISDSRYYRIPQSSLSAYFEVTEFADTLSVYRRDMLVKQVYVWRLKNLTTIPEDPFNEMPAK